MIMELELMKKNYRIYFQVKWKYGSIGIKNIHRRLMKLYGKGLTISRVKENSTKVELDIPYSEIGGMS